MPVLLSRCVNQPVRDVASRLAIKTCARTWREVGAQERRLGVNVSLLHCLAAPDL